MKNGEVATVSKILRNKKNVIREEVNIYKCSKCEGTYAGKARTYCKDPKCKGILKWHSKIPRERVEEITSRRAATQCPACMKMFYVWVENCPYCSTPTLKGKITRKDDPMRKMYDYKMLK